MLKFDAIDVVRLIPIVCSVYDLNRVQYKFLNLNLNGGYVFQEVGKPEILTFKVIFDLEGQGQSSYKTIVILTHVFCTSSPNSVILA